MEVATSIVRDNGSSILLMLDASEELTSQQAWVASVLPAQVPVKELHVTLMRSARKAIPFPAPPPFIELCKEAHLVTDGKKASVYLRVTDAFQSKLLRYVEQIEASLKDSGLRNEGRVFHVSLTNLIGLPKESVANVWEYPSTIL
jgi:hypothetical protein